MTAKSGKRVRLEGQRIERRQAKQAEREARRRERRMRQQRSDDIKNVVFRSSPFPRFSV